MRKAMAVLVVLGLAACTDQPTQPAVQRETAQPAVQRSRLATAGADHGAWIVRYSEADAFCSFWDADGNVVISACSGVYTPNAHAIINSRYSIKGRVANSTGRAVHFGPTNTPQGTIDFYAALFGIGPTVEGLMPLCDFSLQEYPNAWMEWPIPADKMPLLICTTNWHYTVSAAGKATLMVIGDPKHSWRPFAN